VTRSAPGLTHNRPDVTGYEASRRALLQSEGLWSSWRGQRRGISSLPAGIATLVIVNPAAIPFKGTGRETPIGLASDPRPSADPSIPMSLFLKDLAPASGARGVVHHPGTRGATPLRRMLIAAFWSWSQASPQAEQVWTSSRAASNRSTWPQAWQARVVRAGGTRSSSATDRPTSWTSRPTAATRNRCLPTASSPPSGAARRWSSPQSIASTRTVR
jgi:hypothetical protein